MRLTFDDLRALMRLVLDAEKRHGTRGLQQLALRVNAAWARLRAIKGR